VDDETFDYEEPTMDYEDAPAQIVAAKPPPEVLPAVAPTAAPASSSGPLLPTVDDTISSMDLSPPLATAKPEAASSSSQPEVLKTIPVSTVKKPTVPPSPPRKATGGHDRQDSILDEHVSKKAKPGEDSPPTTTPGTSSHIPLSGPILPIAEPVTVPSAPTVPPAVAPPSTEDLDATQEYPEAPVDLDATTEYYFQKNLKAELDTWYITMNKSYATDAVESFDALYHAIRDAETLLDHARRESAGALPWLPSESFISIPGPFHESRCFYYDFREDKCFSVTSDDILTPAEVEKFWTLVEEADRLEVKSFVDNDVFRLGLRTKADNVIDGIWVRRWKDRASCRLKSRLCGRGYLDRQKYAIDRHSSTASRLSHKLVCSQAVQHSLELEAFDITTAFLQGLRFQDIIVAARKYGYNIRALRRVWLRPPGNVWRHLQGMADHLSIDLRETYLYVLELLKAMYGLVDGPLLFQLALLTFLAEDCSLSRSLHDENYLYSSDGHYLICAMVVHVDDLLIAATTQFMLWIAARLETRFGRMKHKCLPFVFLGIKHEMIKPGHLLLDQKEYLDKLEPIKLEASRLTKDLEKCTDVEHHAYRSCACSMLWLCLTRMDLISEVLSLQAEMVCPTVAHCKRANAILRRARQDSIFNGLHYRRVDFPLRVVGYSDSGHATKNCVYPQEGRLVVLTSDRRIAHTEWLDLKQSAHLQDSSHPLFFSGKKASRVSHSTSHGESVAAVGTTQVAQLCASRYTEPFLYTLYRQPIDAHTYIDLNLGGLPCLLPVDHVTDCMDVFELCTGSKGIASDKTQRILILSIREDRWHGLIRHFYHYPTASMLADGLTKIGRFPQLLYFSTTGKFVLRHTEDKYIRWADRHCSEISSTGTSGKD